MRSSPAALVLAVIIAVVPILGVCGPKCGVEPRSHAHSPSAAHHPHQETPAPPCPGHAETDAAPPTAPSSPSCGHDHAVVRVAAIKATAGSTDNAGASVLFIHPLSEIPRAVAIVHMPSSRGPGPTAQPRTLVLRI
jgi:hypothetical protein